jgi:hypothetical protein
MILGHIYQVKDHERIAFEKIEMTKNLSVYMKQTEKVFNTKDIVAHWKVTRRYGDKRNVPA